MEYTKENEQKAKDIEKMLGYLATIRQSCEDSVDEVIKFTNHSRRTIKDKDRVKGQHTGKDVYDGTSMSAAGLLSDGIHGYLCSQNMHWHDFVLPGKMNYPRSSRNMRGWTGKRLDEYPDVKRWLNECEEVQYDAFNRSNFYTLNPSYIREGATVGTATYFIEEDVGPGRIVFTLPHFRECYIAENQYGQVDTVYRVYKLTLRQMVQKWGMERIEELDRQFKTSYKNNPYTEREFIHAVYPRSDFDSTKLNGANKPIASTWVMRSPLKLVENTGYWDYPCVTWRWRKNSDELYGRSPAWDVYVDVMTANQQGKSNLIGGQKMVEGPMIGPSDLRGMVESGPNGWTWVDDMNRLPKPLSEDIKLPYSVEAQERTDKKIREHFHVDFFLMLYQAAFNRVQLTATQVIGMQGEQAAVLGTRVGNFQNEGLDPIMDRVFNIEREAGRMPEPPEIVIESGINRIEIDYLGPLAQAQKKLFRVQSMRAGLEMAGAVAQAIPESLDVIDGDQTMQEALEISGFPPSCIRDDAAIAKKRLIRAQAQQAQLMVQNAVEIGKAMPGAGKKPEEGSPLNQLMTGEIEI